MSEELLGSREFGTRSYVIEDLTVRADGDGRTVEAYAAVFKVQTEIRDQDGHYNEDLAPGSFTKTIQENAGRFGVFYNHARTIYGTPDGALSVPIGVPLEVSQDELPGEAFGHVQPGGAARGQGARGAAELLSSRIPPAGFLG